MRTCHSQTWTKEKKNGRRTAANRRQRCRYEGRRWANRSKNRFREVTRGRKWGRNALIKWERERERRGVEMAGGKPKTRWKRNSGQLSQILLSRESKWVAMASRENSESSTRRPLMNTADHQTQQPQTPIPTNPFLTRRNPFGNPFPTQ